MTPRPPAVIAALAFVLAAAAPVASAPHEKLGRPSARAIADAAARAVSTGGLAEILEAAGIEASAARAGVPSGADQAIDHLARVVADADEQIRAALPRGIRAGEARRAAVRAGLGRASRLPEEAAAVRIASARAAAVLAREIDDVLPLLHRHAAATPSQGTEAGCDVVDQAPTLCVAGTGANRISNDYALVVDLGGDDVHAHSAGGADPLSNGAAVSVTLDLGGNDTYDTALPTSSGSWIAQGGGFFGVGILVDSAGSDTYRIETRGPYALAMGQGKGEHGVGILADSEGDDRYELATSGDGLTLSAGQGEGANGTGILVDRSGDDRYAVRSTATGFHETPLGLVLPPSAAALGMGVGRNGYIVLETPNPVHVDAIFAGRGYGLFADTAGSDELTATATSADPAQDGAYGPSLAGLPLAHTFALGYGEQLGAGIALLGPGATTSSVTSAARAPLAESESYGMGLGVSFGVGVLDDAGGPDQRELAADVRVVRRAEAERGCAACDAPAANARSRHARVEGMGAGIDYGAGLIQDRGADPDLYHVSVRSAASASVRDRREHGDPGAANAVAGASRAKVQGSGEGNGYGELVDEGGADRYEVAAASEATADGGEPETGRVAATSATSAAADVFAQAAARALGHASLRDTGGSDGYSVAATSRAFAGDGTSSAGVARAGALASVDEGSSASFADADGGEPDVFSADPWIAACTGTRGGDAWVDCGGAGIGVVR